MFARIIVLIREHVHMHVHPDIRVLIGNGSKLFPQCNVV